MSSDCAKRHPIVHNSKVVQDLNIKLGIQIGNIKSHRFSKFEQESIKHCQRVNNKFHKSYDLPLDLLQYQRDISAKYLFLFGIAGGQEVDHNFCSLTLVQI